MKAKSLGLACALCLLSTSLLLTPAWAQVTIASFLAKNSDTTAVAKLLETAGLMPTIQEELAKGPLTLLVPRTSWLSSRLSTLMNSTLLDPANNAILKDILLFHVMRGKLTRADLVKGPTERFALNGDVLHFTHETGPDRLTVEKGTPIRPADVYVGKDGAVHEISGLLLPPASTAFLCSTPALTCTPGGTGPLSPIAPVVSPTTPPKNYSDPALNALSQNGNFKTILALLNGTEDGAFADAIKGIDGPYTILAPTDSAFKDLPEYITTALMGSGSIPDVLKYHVITSKTNVTTLLAAGPQNLSTALGVPVRAIPSGPLLTFSGNTSVQSLGQLTEGTNFSIIAVDGVLVPASIAATLPAAPSPPPAAVSSSPPPPAPGAGPPSEPTAGDALGAVLGDADYSAFTQSLNSSGVQALLADVKDPITLLTFNNTAKAAFDAQVNGTKLGQELGRADGEAEAKLFLSHAIVGNFTVKSLTDAAPTSLRTLSGENITVTKAADGSLLLNGKPANLGDIQSGTFSALSVDTVVVPTSDQAALGQPAANPAPTPTPRGTVISGLLSDNGDKGNSGALLKALQGAGLDAALAGTTEPITILAPSDDAIKASPLGTLDPNSTDAKTILQYHVLKGRYNADTLRAIAPASLATLVPGKTVQITTGPTGTILANGVIVDREDLGSNEGVSVQGISGVLSPPGSIIPGFTSPPPPPSAGVDLGPILGQRGFSALQQDLEDAGIADALLSTKEPITLLAFNDTTYAAFKKSVNSTSLGAALDNTDGEAKAKLLEYNILLGNVTADSLLKDAPLTVQTLGNETINVTKSADGSSLLFNGKEVNLKSLKSGMFSASSIDRVLVPPSLQPLADTPAPPTGAPGPAAVPRSVVFEDLLGNKDKGNSNELLGKLRSAGLTSAVAATEGAITVFAPSNDAVGDSPLDYLDPKSPEARAILQYHVVPGRYTAETLRAIAPDFLKTQEGATLAVTEQNSDIFVNGVRVDRPDSAAADGITIQGIDKVLLPPDVKIPGRPDDGEDGPNVGAIVGGTLGGVFILLCCCCCLFFLLGFCGKRRNRRQSQRMDDKDHV